jgi:hypothetical protein
MANSGGGGAPEPDSNPRGTRAATVNRGAQNIGRGSSTEDIQITCSGITTPKQAPDLHIFPGWDVTVLGIPSNVSPIGVSQIGPDAAVNGPRLLVNNSGTEYPVNIRNLNDLFAAGSLGDKLNIRIRKN